MTNLKSWKRKLRNMVDYPWESDGDSDHPECPNCGSTMNFNGHDDNGDFPIGEGYWECEGCNFKIREDEV